MANTKRSYKKDALKGKIYEYVAKVVLRYFCGHTNQEITDWKIKIL